jgi:NAD(P)-dependent dehydrogenase (short-subunit alcohol dehydrogenase family)
MAEPDWHPDGWTVDPASMFDLSETTAIVTGGGSGLGRAIALGFGARGASVAIGDVDTESANEVVNAIDGEAMAAEADVTDQESLEQFRGAVIDEYGGYDVVVNVPGINVRKPALELTEEEWRRVVDVNLTGMYLGATVLGEPLVEAGAGSVVNMASVLGVVGLERQGAYAASKGGVVQLTRVLASEWAPEVRVNALAPGYMKTPLVVQVMDDEEWYEDMRRRHLMDRFGEPEEVVGAALFLASEASSFVTGTVLPVDGGWSAQ